MAPPAHASSPSSSCPERAAGLAFLPVLATGLFYLAPSSVRDSIVAQFLPQALSYLAFLVWARLNGQVIQRLRLEPHRVRSGLAWGIGVGVGLGMLNVCIILQLVPWLGYDITFLTETPHARIPFWVMIPWFVSLIALFVEFNFRGFLLGRLLALSPSPVLAVAVSAAVFACDPFLVSTFKHLHWIAVWDGLVWGMMWMRLENLYATITAHAVEVMIMYSIVRAALS